MSETRYASALANLARVLPINSVADHRALLVYTTSSNDQQCLLQDLVCCVALFCIFCFSTVSLFIRSTSRVNWSFSDHFFAPFYLRQVLVSFSRESSQHTVFSCSAWTCERVIIKSYFPKEWL